jgi:putative flippase GtrA
VAALARPSQLARFGTVGGLAFVVDAGLFNLLRFGPGAVLEAKPVTAKVVSVAVATLVAWLGNRYWAFADSRRENRVRELVAFCAVNLGGMVIAAGCLAVSHYALGLTSPLADNVSANGVGLALGTAFRYAAYRWLVFTGGGAVAPRPPALPGEEPHPGQVAVGLRSGTARTRPAGAAPG